MVEMETTGNTKVTKPSAEEVEFTGKNVDSALVFLNNSGDVTFTQEEERSLVCKVDWMLLPLLAAIYMLQFVDKNLINFANIMGLGVDTGTSSQQFTTLAWSYWVTYLLSQPLTGYVLQKLPVAKVLGWNVTLWGVVVALNCVCKNYASLLALRIVLPAQDAARSFQRNYKACDNCRLKKKRCELGADQQGVYGFTGPPCASCRRERRQCVFREARDTKKKVIILAAPYPSQEPCGNVDALRSCSHRLNQTSTHGLLAQLWHGNKSRRFDNIAALFAV